MTGISTFVTAGFVSDGIALLQPGKDAFLSSVLMVGIS